MPIRLSNVCTWLSGGQVHFLLQLETRLTEVTRRDSWNVPCRHRSRRCLSSWRATRCSWSRSLLLFYPSVRTPLLGDNTRCFQRPVAVSVPWTQFLRLSSNRLLGSMSCFSGVDLGRSGHVLFIFNRQNKL